MSAAGLSRRPNCPRCGYDLSGAVDSWTDRCPLEGVCPECGYLVVWSEIFRFGDCPWLFEWYGRRSFRRLWVTIWRALWPWSFFRSVREVRGRPTDAMASGLMILLVIHLFTLAASLLGRDAVPIWPYASGPRWRHGRSELITGIWSHVCFFATLLVPVVLAILPLSWRRSGVSRRDLVRPASYSMVLLLVLMVTLVVVWLIEVHNLPGELESLTGVWWITDAWWRIIEWNIAAWAGLYGVLLAAYWGIALRQYVGLHRPFMAAFAVTAVSMVSGMMIVAYSNPSGTRESMFWDLYPVSGVIVDFLEGFGVDVGPRRR